VKKKVGTGKTPKQAVPSFRLDPATRSDFAEWKAMRSEMFSDLDDAYHEREMKLILESADQACLLVREPGGRTVGFLEVSLRNVVDGCLGGPVGYIEGIYLIPAFRGLGLGGVLVDAVAEWFASQGCSNMATDTEIDNEEAQAFWSGLGFEETWRIVQYRKPIGAAAARRRTSRSRS
jgi:aminoglycoside 6'-N-acetyltransferase I